MKSTKLIQHYIGPHILKITLHDAASANALSLEAAHELKAIIRKLSQPQSPVKVLIFTGSGRFFCSGGNLKFYQSLKSKTGGLKVNREIAKVLSSLDRLPLYKIAWVNADCLGGGLELMSCFDHIAAVPHCLFGFWQSRQALSFAWGGGARLTRRIPLQIVKNSLLSSQVFSAFEAQKIGLIDRVFSRFEIEAQVLQLAEKISHSSADAQLGIRKLNAKNESVIFSKLWWSPAHRSVLFRQK